MIEDAIEKINLYMKQDKISVFIGAGVSRLVGYPTWNELVRCMVGELDGVEYKDSYSTDELLRIPQMYKDYYGEKQYLDLVKNQFDGVYSPNEVHDLILSMHPKHILTTNYDSLLEETAYRFGEHYSVIKSDMDVSETDAERYLIKAHGDLDGLFVLKEEDYLNYETNYVLVDKLIKSVFATTLVIFIGYSLNDYNIKLIMNWVKRIQGDSFISPVFIYTGKPLCDADIMYQTNRGLNVVDCNALVQFQNDDDFLRQYVTILSHILDYKDNNAENSLLFECNKRIKGLENIQYFRNSDFNSIFKGRFCIDSSGYVDDFTRLTNFDDLFTRHKFIGDVSDVDCTKYYPELIQFIEHCELYKDKTGWKKKHVYSLEDAGVFLDEDYMIDFCEKSPISILDRYRKAYYLSQLMRFQESYILFTELLLDLKNTDVWDLYYLIQLNRWYLYLIISKSNNYIYGSIYDNDFISKLENEMGHFRVENLFNNLPARYRINKDFLRDLCRKNPYEHKYKTLLDDVRKASYDISSGTIYMIGNTKADSIKHYMLEEIKFSYCNMLLFPFFSEFKSYIKTALMTWMEYYSDELNKAKQEQKEHQNVYPKFTFDDVVILSRTCDKDDITNLNKMGILRDIVLAETDTKRLVEYIILNIKKYYTFITDKERIVGEDILYWDWKSEELKRLLEISAYFISDNQSVLRIISLIKQLHNSNFRMNEVVSIIRCFMYYGKLSDKDIIDFVENWIVANSDWKTEDLKLILDLLDICNEPCKMQLLSEFVVNNKLNNQQLLSLNNAFLLLNEEAKNIISSTKKATIIDLYVRYKNYPIDNKGIIYEALQYSYDKIIQRREETRANGVVVTSAYSVETEISMGIILLLNNKCVDNKELLSKYAGISDEYDFWFTQENLSDDRIDLQWFRYYNDDILNLIKSDDIKKNQLIRILGIDSNRKTKDVNLLQRMIYLYDFLVKE